MIGPVMTRLLDPRPLGAWEARDVFDALLVPDALEAERAAILVGLTARKENAHELANLASEMRRRARPFTPPGADRAVDLCGSGGAPHPHFNISTVSSFVVAASGAPVIKHGNRSSRGIGGSSELLVALGLPVETSIDFPRASFRKHKLAFLHAPLFHPATAAVASARRLLGVPTVFNRLGPLSNPARVRYQVVGCGQRSSSRPVVDALRELGVRRGVTMTSEEGCDEFSPNCPTHLTAWSANQVRNLKVHPEELLPTEDRTGDWGPLSPESAADETERILAGGGGARRGSVLLSAGAALWVAGRAPSLAAGVERSREVLDGGAPERLLGRLQQLAGSYAGSPGR
jgi:anthranilate phosphoribosyltransferase